MKKEKQHNQQIAEEAASWAVMIDGGVLSSEERQAFTKWLQASDVHFCEFLLAASLLNGVTYAKEGEDFGVEDIIAQSENVVSLGRDTETAIEQREQYSPTRRRGVFRLRILAYAAGFALTIASSIVLTAQLSNWNNSSETIAKTALGEQREFQLEDGTSVLVNTNTHVKMRLTKNERIAELTYGEAFFRVAPDEQRPFKVVAGDTVIQVVGTEFNLRRLNSKTMVEVVEGIVAIGRAAGALEKVSAAAPETPDALKQYGGRFVNGRALLTVGETARIDGSKSVLDIENGPVSKMAAWRQQQLIFDDSPIVAIAAEFNRYNRQNINIVGSEIQSIRLSGVFDATDLESFIEFLRLTEGIAVEESGDQYIVRSYTDD